MGLEQIPSRKLTETEKQDMRDKQNSIFGGIMQKVASHNIQNPHYSRIKDVLDDLNNEFEKHLDGEWVL